MYERLENPVITRLRMFGIEDDGVNYCKVCGEPLTWEDTDSFCGFLDTCRNCREEEDDEEMET